MFVVFFSLLMVSLVQGTHQRSGEMIEHALPFLNLCFWGILKYRRRKRMADTNEANMAVPEMKLELVPVPVSDVDRAKAFYDKAGFTLGVDTRTTDTMRVVQFTPPGSACTVVFGTCMCEINEMTPGLLRELQL